MSRRTAGFTLTELMIVVLVIAILATVTISSLTSAQKNAKDKAAETQIDGAAIRIAEWANQSGADTDFGDNTGGTNLTNMGLLSDLATPSTLATKAQPTAATLVNSETWTTTGPAYPSSSTTASPTVASAKGQIYIDIDCRPVGNTPIVTTEYNVTPCVRLVACLPYFTSGKNLCLENQIWPRGSTANAGLHTRRRVYCVPACTANIYTSTTNGSTAGTLAAVETQTENNTWPNPPSINGN